jgi:hypothetical protein
VPRAELACGREGDDGDVMAAQSVRPALRLLAGRAICMAARCCILHDVEIRSICVSGVARVVRPGPGTSQSQTCRARQRLVVRGGDFLCEAETSRVRWKLLVRGGDLSCEGSSSGKLVGDAAKRLKTGRLASEGLDEDLHTTMQAEH